ncbi:MAG: DUF4956 domain-containing protein [Pseudomonadales bacterium]
MRKSSRLSAPLIVVSLYYGLAFGVFHAAVYAFPELEPYMPVGGIQALIDRGANTFQDIEILSSEVFYKTSASSLAIAIIAATALMVPISWVYFITTRDNELNRSFAQTMLLLPIIVAGIANIVQNSIPLAFSLAGIVAAVRFRFTLTDPAHTLYIFAAITIGLGAGIAAIGVSLLISVGFVYATLLLWRLDYGRNLNSPFYSFLTGRDYGNEDDDKP